MNSFYSKEELKELGLKKYGTNVLISRKASLYDVINITLGDNVRIDDFVTIRRKANLIDNFPSYLEEISMTFKDFMISTIYAVFNIVKHYHKRLIEINKFLKILKKVLDEYGLKKSLEDIKEFYSMHAIELGFKHVPSRNPDLFVPLYTSTGKKMNFSYISLE